MHARWRVRLISITKKKDAFHQSSPKSESWPVKDLSFSLSENPISPTHPRSLRNSTHSVGLCSPPIPSETHTLSASDKKNLPSCFTDRTHGHRLIKDADPVFPVRPRHCNLGLSLGRKHWIAIHPQATLSNIYTQ